MRLLLLFASLASIAYAAGIASLLQHAQAPPNGELYAVLVAGSDGWYNYRHQADVAHAYHTLRNHGVPEKNIIVLMKDDVAHHRRNPYPGKLFNKPHGEDVYHGLKIDYKGNAVTPGNFLNILKGNAKAVRGGNGRVVKSNKNDRIFVYFTDHGGVGLISFPDDTLSVKQLNDALKWMHKNKRFNQLVFYLEACESGSMFEKVLPNNINVYAITAASADESSWAAYCETDMKLPCLGDLFSVSWMEDSDQKDLNVETLDAQYEVVKKLTNLSQVHHYGDLSIAKEPVGWFQGTSKGKSQSKNTYEKMHKTAAWPSRDVELMHLQRMKGSQFMTDPRIVEIFKVRRNIEAVFEALVDAMVQDPMERREAFMKRSAVESVDCHDEVVHAFDAICIDVNKYDYALKYMNVLNNLCTKFNDSAKIISAIWATCRTAHSQFV